MSKLNRRKPTSYEIRIKEHIHPRWSGWFEECNVQRLENGQTILSGLVVDQAALHGLLGKIRDLNLTLLSVTQIEPPQNRDE